MTPLLLEYEADDYVSALTLHATWSLRRWLVHVALAFAAAAALFVSFPGWPAIVAGGVLGGAVGSLVCYGLSRTVYLPWKARRMFRQQKSLHDGYELAWDEDGLSVRGRRGQGTTPWREYLKRKENDRLVLLYQSDVLFQMLPKRAFDDESLRSIRPYLDGIRS